MKNIIYILIFPFILSCEGKTAKPIIVENAKILKEIDTISGIYEIVAYTDTIAPSCGLRIAINRNGEEYSYHIVSTERDVKGKLSFFRNTGSNELGLEFTGLPYDSYDERFNDHPDVSGVLANDTLIFQTYGNSMNEYTKLGECGDKYIALVRKPQ